MGINANIFRQVADATRDVIIGCVAAVLFILYCSLFVVAALTADGYFGWSDLVVGIVGLGVMVLQSVGLVLSFSKVDLGLF